MKTHMHKPLRTLVLLVALLLPGSSVFLTKVFAATGSMYLTPASITAQQGNNFSVSLRINPGGNTDTVAVNLGFDAAKLQYVSSSFAGSPYDTRVGFSATTGNISFSATKLGGASISTDSFIASITFKALSGSGSSSLSLAGSNAAYAGTATNPSLVNATVHLTTPGCPSGQTGIWPNCVTPPPAGGSGSGGGSTGVTGGSGSVIKSGGSSGGTSTKPAGGSSQKPDTAAVTTPPPAADTTGSAATPLTVSGKKIQFTQAVFTLTGNEPTQAYIRYGTGSELTTNTPVSDFATTHTIALDPTLLVPGETYTYVVVSTDRQGVTAQTAKQTFTTKGMTITLGVFDKNHHALKNQTVTLHSVTQTAKTDNRGFVTFTNVASGPHHLIYSAGKQSYDESFKVDNNVQTVQGVQTAATQNFSIVYGFTQAGPWWSSVGFIAVLALLVLAGAVWFVWHNGLLSGRVGLPGLPVFAGAGHAAALADVTAAPTPETAPPQESAPEPTPEPTPAPQPEPEPEQPQALPEVQQPAPVEAPAPEPAEPKPETAPAPPESPDSVPPVLRNIPYPERPAPGSIFAPQYYMNRSGTSGERRF